MSGEENPRSLKDRLGPKNHNHPYQGRFINKIFVNYYPFPITNHLMKLSSYLLDAIWKMKTKHFLQDNCYYTYEEKIDCNNHYEKHSEMNP